MDNLVAPADLLSTRKIDAALANLSLSAMREHLQIVLQAARLNDILEPKLAISNPRYDPEVLVSHLSSSSSRPNKTLSLRCVIS